MSMISAQCDELRRYADRADGTFPMLASALRDAADTIWELRCRLVDAEDRVRKSGELCKLCEREAENAKLREIIADLEELLPESERWYSHETVKAIAEDNAKLRELINLKQTCWKYVGLCDECPYNGVDDEHDDCNCTVREKVNSLARELGVEVDG